MPVWVMDIDGPGTHDPDITAAAPPCWDTPSHRLSGGLQKNMHRMVVSFTPQGGDAMGSTERPDAGGGIPEPVAIRLLGGFSVSVGNRQVRGSEWRLRKSRSLVQLLTLSRTHRLHREQVLELLWPDMDLKAAAANLRSTLYAARRALDPQPSARSQYLALEQDQLVLCPSGQLWVDVDAFEDAVRIARATRDPSEYRAATKLYAGDLLPEELYDDWVNQRCEELRRQYLALLLELAGLHEVRGELAAGIESLRRVVSTDPTHEEAHATLMRLYAASGERYKAQRQYAELRTALQAELGAEPDASTQRLYRQIVSEELPGVAAQAPPPTTAAVSDRKQHNLPTQLSSFIGREAHKAEVTRLLSTNRLVTLTGAGGCGKTRLALATAGDLLGEYNDGVWLAELAALSDPQLVPEAVVGALELREQPGQGPMELLTEHLRPRELLLVLDNCEHLVDACAQLVQQLLRACPQLRVLATSRASLRAEGEVNWLVPSLSLPHPGKECSPVELPSYEAATLFLQRAQQHRPDFELTESNCVAVVEICLRLAGIPLAIELAAARVRSMSVDQIVARLDSSLSLLGGGARTASPRQQTLQATLDWSMNMLGEPERRLFRWLSVFRGGWSLEEAELAGAVDASDSMDVPELLGLLVEKSLTLAETSADGSMRYRMLEPVRQYAEVRLEESGEGEAARAAHAAVFLALARRAEPELRGPRQVEWYRRLEAERDNLRAALSWYFEHGRSEEAARLGTALWIFWWVRGPLSEGRRWMDALLGVGERLPTTLQAWVLMVAASLAYGRRDFEPSTRLARQIVEMPRQEVEGRCWGLAHAGIGLAALERRDYREAKANLQEALRTCTDASDDWGANQVLAWLGMIKLTEGDPAAAREMFREALTLARRVGDRLNIYIVLYHLALAEQAQGNHEAAGELFREALALSRQLGDQANTGYCLEGLAGVAWALGDAERSARLFGASDALLGKADGPIYSYYRPDPSLRERTLAAVRCQLGDAAFEPAWDYGRRMSPDEATSHALSAPRLNSR